MRTSRSRAYFLQSRCWWEPSNTRVQRTRVLASLGTTRVLAVARNARPLRVLARSPLTRHPLGGSSSALLGVQK